MKLLIVDDDLLLCSALARGLIRLGHASRTASSVDSALELMGAEAPAAILTDLDLGVGGNGVELLKRLRQAGSTIPAILMTGSDVAHARAQLADAGLPEISILEKPFDLLDLLAKLGELLPMPRPSTADRKPPPGSMAAFMDNVVRALGGRAV